MTTTTEPYKFTEPKRRTKTAFDFVHVKSVSAIALLWEGKPAGRIVANYSDGGTVTASVGVWVGPLKDMPYTTGQAGGYGYDKLSAAVYEALTKVGWKCQHVGHGNGATEKEFTALGYEAFTVV